LAAGISVRDRLLADRRALLDLGTRNRLINIPLRTKNIRAIEIVDEKSSSVFSLLSEGKRFSFLSGKAASPEDESVQTKRERAVRVTNAGPYDRADGEATAQRRHSDARLQTKLSP
jgi:hypothetical protein